ncbi:MAG: DUF1802 family protein [Cytophagales bacterium]|nr:MAG: DUF1802 family protein [Cytophagales bacterium]
MALVFKEWSFIVDALGKGLQSLILRKGGIAEDADLMQSTGDKFYLMPTLFHQAETMLKSDWVAQLEGDRFHQTSNHVLISYYAQVVLKKDISDWEMVKKLNDQHAWKEDVISERFNRWDKNISLMIVQVYELNHTISLEMLPEYGGCKSWLNIDLPEEFEGKLIENKKIKGTFF